LGINEWKKSVFTSDFDDIKLQHLYRSLDILEKNKTLVQKMLYNEQLSLFKDKINLVFYDLTTLYFESQEVDSDGLKRFGYSKDNKTDCVQITMGLVLNENNIPLGFDLFPGNTYEGNTVEDMIHKLKKTYDIEKIVVVADRGILNKKVISQIEESGYEYILASKLSSLPEAIQEEVFTDVGYEEVNPDLKMKELSFNNSRLIVFHSEKRSHRDKKQRDMVLSKLKKRLEKDKKTSISPSYKKYLRITDFSSEIDSDKVKDSEKRDGYFGFHCNNKDFSKLDILNSYRMLWQIEESFRCCKSYLDLRPIYHWTDRRITGHIMMCFISFYLLRIIQKLLSDNSIDLSPDKLFTSLSEIVCVEMKVSNKGHRDNVLYGRTSISGLNNHIFRSLEFPIPPFILKKY
jgi:transposase